MQNLVIFMEPSPDAYDISLKGGNMILNRFCIDEDAAFELSGVNYLEKSSYDIRQKKSIEFKEKRKVKGMEYSFLRSYFILRNSTLRNLTLISMNN